ncbi:CoA ester lyase [Acidipropionibacterium jensenii]|uniref:HpcH/HpaI aldolase/citrate lyase family protein n=1 Tax=Acidipropionibacterium jensenii TaxID=1749 RepID=UPI000BC363E6|nr:CoA ester lyase [Acidipropionibacterium jensenii]AZZ42779.1 CoA ester lyase [Acidipropionibacterium jensenii]
MPGANARALEKAKTLPCDAIIIDLEDAVAPAAKPEARDRAAQVVSSRPYGSREVVIRINGMDTPWYREDLVAAVAAVPNAIAVPKVGSADQVRTIAAEMSAAGAGPEMSIWAMIETPRAVLDCLAIAEASDRLDVLVMGTNDLTKELRASHVPGRGPVTTALQMCVLAARAAGRVILDGVYNDVRDAAGFRSQAHEAMLMGFDGKTLIHPSQVGPANEVFAPDADEIAEAHGIIEAWEAGEGSGVVTYNGRMIENLHVETARRVLAMAQAISTD